MEKALKILMDTYNLTEAQAQCELEDLQKECTLVNNLAKALISYCVFKHPTITEMKRFVCESIDDIAQAAPQYFEKEN